MNKYIRVIVTVTAIAGYYLLLRYVAPSNEPYFILGIALIGFIAWLDGVTAGLALALFLTALTFYIYDQFEVAFSYDTFARAPAYIALQIFVAAALGGLRRKTILLSKKKTMLMRGNETLQTTLSNVREMGGIHSLCTSCKSILDDDGTWTNIDTYLKDKTKAEFSHGICPECAEKFGQKIDSKFVQSTEPAVLQSIKKPASFSGNAG